MAVADGVEKEVRDEVAALAPVGLVEALRAEEDVPEMMSPMTARNLPGPEQRSRSHRLPRRCSSGPNSKPRRSAGALACIGVLLGTQLRLFHRLRLHNRQSLNPRALWPLESP